MCTISLCMIVKNEEDVLERCLSCMTEIVDEIIVVDTGSEDKTKEIAQRFTNHVYDFVWIDDFSAARNFAFSKATKDYIMWLDADDILQKEDQQKLLTLKTTLDPVVDIVMMKYNTAFDENGNPTFSYYRERLLKRERNFQWEGKIHEAISLSGVIIYTNVAITHAKLQQKDKDRNLRIFEQMIARGEQLCPREQYYYARELYYHAQYEKAITVFQKFLNDKQGYLENNISACEDLANCYLQLGETEQAICSLYRSFEYDKPRAEICCMMGKIFLQRKAYYNAIYWYKQALSSEIPKQSSAFVRKDCYEYLPAIQLCLCYDRLGEKGWAEFYNEKAGSYKPNDKSYLYNVKYFASLKKK